MTLFKVLGPKGEAVHGGSGSWPLPTTDGPGEWMRVSGALRLCSNGLHLTDKPMLWWQPNARLFEVEVAPEAEMAGSLDDGDHKIAVNAARLLREVDWSQHNVWSEGAHTVSEGEARAYDSATVNAYGSATVNASGSATVTASDSATVNASGSATVTAYGRATVISSVSHSRSAVVTLAQKAVHVDRRGDAVELRKAEAS